jgi:hypothetical protein
VSGEAGSVREKEGEIKKVYKNCELIWGKCIDKTKEGTLTVNFPQKNK